MVQRFLSIISLCAALTLLLFSCRQPIDLDVDRSVVATNLPEITDFSPKVVRIRNGDRITITGKNFVNVKKVMIDTLTLDSIIIENRGRISARVPNQAPRGSITISRTYKISVFTPIGVTESQQKVALADNSLTGFISFNEQPLDSVVIIATYTAKNLVTQTLTGYGINMKSSGFYDIWIPNINAGSFTVPNGANFTVRPFLSGYTFTPAEQTVTFQNQQGIGETEFKASKVPPDKMPEFTSITPSTGYSFSGSAETGTLIELRGKGFTGLRKIMIGIPYQAPGSQSIRVEYTEATEFTMKSDGELSVRLPRFDRTKALSGRTYPNCQIYLLRDDASILAPQRISITYI